MSVKVHIHKIHRRFTDGLGVIEVEGGTVGECLERLVGHYPDLEAEIFAKKGKLNSIMEVYVNGKSAYPNELAKPVRDGDEIYLTMMLAGG